MGPYSYRISVLRRRGTDSKSGTHMLALSLSLFLHSEERPCDDPERGDCLKAEERDLIEAQHADALILGF